VGRSQRYALPDETNLEIEMKVKWVYCGSQGDWDSADGRFSICGCAYWGGVSPTAYRVRDKQSFENVHGVRVTASREFKTVAKAKAWAAARVQ